TTRPRNWSISSVNGTSGRGSSGARSSGSVAMIHDCIGGRLDVHARECATSGTPVASQGSTYPPQLQPSSATTDLALPHDPANERRQSPSSEPCRPDLSRTIPHGRSWPDN